MGDYIIPRALTSFDRRSTDPAARNSLSQDLRHISQSQLSSNTTPEN